MVRTVVIDGKKYQIDQLHVLGSGGEATVVQVNSWAVKIYHKINSARVEKLRDFVQKSPGLPQNVCAPQHLVHDSTGRKVIGFAMRCMSRGQHEVVQMLSSKKYRRTNPKYNSRFITDLFIADYKTTEQLHSASIIIGDNNDLNKMFDLYKPVPIFIDVDSFQFNNYPCMVATEAYLDPALYNVDLGSKCYFNALHDWYAFWAMYIKSLIMVHPYGGVHNQYRSIPQRALHRVTIFDSSVRYPKAGLNIDILSDDLKAVTERIFAKGDRLKPEMELLREYRDSLIKCGSCLTLYPGERNSCPQCSTVNTQQIQRRVNVVQAPGKRTVNVQELLFTLGNFVWFKQYRHKIFAIAREQRIGGAGGPPQVYSLHCRDGTQIIRQDLMAANGINPRFDMFGGRYLVVNTDQSDNKITIYDTQGKLTKIDEKLCDDFHGRRMFACSKDHLMRIQNGFLHRGYVHPTLKTYVELQVFGFMKNQTWFVASPIDTSIFGFQRFFNNMQFFMMRFDRKKQEQHTINLPSLEQNESILSVSVRFAVSSILFLMKTEIRGKTYVRVFVIHLDDGHLISHYRVESLPSDTHRNIHGKAFAKPSGTNGFILHPTDDGIVQETIGNNRIENQTLLGETEQFVADGDSVLQYQQGIIVVGDKTVNYLTIT